MFFCAVFRGIRSGYNFYSQISVRVSAPSYRFVVVNTETSDISHGAVSSATPCHESLLN